MGLFVGVYQVTFRAWYCIVLCYVMYVLYPVYYMRDMPQYDVLCPALYRAVLFSCCLVLGLVTATMYISYFHARHAAEFITGVHS